MSQSIYIAAPFAARDFAKEVAQALIDAGHTVTSTWILSERAITTETVGTSPETEFEQALEHARGDVDDVLRSDLLLQITSEACLLSAHEIPQEWLHTGGRHVEFGVAIANGTPCHLLGAPENIFTRTMAACHRTVEDFLEFIELWS